MTSQTPTLRDIPHVTPIACPSCTGGNAHLVRRGPDAFSAMAGRRSGFSGATIAARNTRSRSRTKYRHGALRHWQLGDHALSGIPDKTVPIDKATYNVCWMTDCYRTWSVPYRLYQWPTYLSGRRCLRDTAVLPPVLQDEEA